MVEKSSLASTFPQWYWTCSEVLQMEADSGGERGSQTHLVDQCWVVNNRVSIVHVEYTPTTVAVRIHGNLS